MLQCNDVCIGVNDIDEAAKHQRFLPGRLISCSEKSTKGCNMALTFFQLFVEQFVGLLVRSLCRFSNILHPNADSTAMQQSCGRESQAAEQWTHPP